MVIFGAGELSGGKVRSYADRHHCHNFATVSGMCAGNIALLRKVTLSVG